MVRNKNCGCNMPGLFFLIVIDWMMRKTVANGKNGFRRTFTSTYKYDDFDFTDDIAIIFSSKQQIQG